MKLTARDLMRTDLLVVEPDLALTELDRKLLTDHVSGFPVVEDGRLVGIVSRADIVRQLCVEQTIAEVVSDYYRQDAGIEHDAGATLKEIGDQVGERIEHLQVRDVMVRRLFTVSAETPLDELARTFAAHRIHRLPVVEGERLVGIIGTLDLVRLIADGRLVPV